ncbi:MAG: chorismate synthase [Actinobacteria bacterium]|nr:MAG: chorismate synthase [Actinomycetota bacterium]
MLKYMSAGESHGQALVSIIEGIPSGLSLTHADINAELARRKLGFGRGARMKIENDKAKILSGVRFGYTIGSPVSLLIENKDWPNWQEMMAVDSGKSAAVTTPRPGHADLAGVLKHQSGDIRNVLERSSARSTASLVAIGAIAKKLLSAFGISIVSEVKSIGEVSCTCGQIKDIAKVDSSPVRCQDDNASKEMVKAIEKAAKEGQSLGGTFEVAIFGLPAGLGNYSSFERRLDGKICGAIASIPAIKGVEIGKGFELASLKGSCAHDEIFYDKNKGYHHKTNNAGGLEGGMTNGETLLITAAMKPIPTLGNPLKSVDIITKEQTLAFKERADVCAVPAAAVIAEAAVGLVLAEAFLEKFGGDSLGETKRNFDSYIKTTI